MHKSMGFNIISLKDDESNISMYVCILPKITMWMCFGSMYLKSVSIYKNMHIHIYINALT